MEVAYAVYSTIGATRKENQDNYFVNGFTRPIEVHNSKHSGSFQGNMQTVCVCDGMGGEEAGEIAAFLAVKSLENCLPCTSMIEWQTYIQTADTCLREYENKNDIRMGTTFAGVTIKDNEVFAINVGDTRIYHISNNTISQLSIDDTVFQNLVDIGILKKEDFHNTYTHNYLTQHLGMSSSNSLLSPHYSKEHLDDNDIILICSDGLYGSVSDDDMLHIILSSQSLITACQNLARASENQGSRDNITVLLLQVHLGYEMKAIL